MRSNFGLIHQVYSLSELIRQQYEDLEPKMCTILGTPEIFGIRQIIITGCGDSYAAALAVKDAFMELTGLMMEAVPAIELSRTAPDFIFGSFPDNPLVIAVSNSGSVMRMNEAMERAGGHGVFTLAVTGNRQSELAKSALRVLDLEVPPFEPAPGTRSYVVSLMMLLLIAIRIGEVRGHYPMDIAMSMRYDMMTQARQLEDALSDMDNSMKQLAESWMDSKAFDFVGTGMEYRAVRYAHVKVVEQLGRYSFYKNSEDWFHIHIFFRNMEKIGTVIFADSRSPAANRTRETIGYAAQLGRPLLVIGDEKVELPSRGIAVPVTEYRMNSCLTQFAPVSLLADHTANLIGEGDGRGCGEVWSTADGARCIRDNRVEILWSCSERNVVGMIQEIQIKTDKKDDLVELTGRIDKIVKASGVEGGLCTVHCLHTTASIVITSRMDATGSEDLIEEVGRPISTRIGFKHQFDMPADAAGHIKSTMMGVESTLIISDGAVMREGSQRISFMGFDGPRERKVLVPVRGE